MQFKFLFKHIDKKHFGSVLALYEAQDYYLKIVLDRNELNSSILTKDLTKVSSLKIFDEHFSFPDTLEIDISNCHFYVTTVDLYLRQAINSLGYQMNFYQKEKPLRNLVLSVFIFFVVSVIATFCFKQYLIWFIGVDILLFTIFFMLSIKFNNRHISNMEIDYFTSTYNKNLLDTLYMLQIKKELKETFKDIDYFTVFLNEQKRPEVYLIMHCKKHYLAAKITDLHFKYAFVSDKVEEQDIDCDDYIIEENNFKKPEDIVETIKKLTISLESLNPKKK